MPIDFEFYEDGSRVPERLISGALRGSIPSNQSYCAMSDDRLARYDDLGTLTAVNGKIDLCAKFAFHYKIVPLLLRRYENYHEHTSSADAFYPSCATVCNASSLDAACKSH